MTSALATLTSLSADELVQATTTDGDNGTETDTAAGTNLTGTDTETYQDSDQGTAQTHAVITGSGTNLSATVDETDQDGFTDSDQDNASGSEGVDPNNPTAGAAGADLEGLSAADLEQLQGTEVSNDGDSGTQTLTVHSTWQTSDSGSDWNSTGETGDLTVTTAANASEVDDGSSQEAAGPTPGSASEHDTEGGSVSDTEHVHFSGTATNLSVTVDDTEDDASTEADRGNDAVPGATAGTDSQDGAFSANSGTTDHETDHEAYTFDGTNWTLLSATLDSSSSDTFNEGDAGDQAAGTGTSASTFNDSAAGADTDAEQMTGSGTSFVISQDQSSSVNWSDAETQGTAGTTGASSDAVGASATFTLHRDLADNDDTLSLQDATLTVDGSFTDAATGAATFQIQVSGGPTNFTTTIDETGTDAFATLTVTVDATDTWLDDFAAQVEGILQGQLGSTSGDWSPGGQATNQTGSDSNGGTTTTQVSGGIETDTTTDAAGHVLDEKVFNQASGVVLYQQSATYDAQGNELTSTDGMGRTTAWTYDAAGHQTSETVAAGTPQAATTTYVWQGNNEVQVIDPDGNVTRYTYDAQGQETSMTDPLGHTQTWTYNAQGEVASETNRDGLRIDYTYDDAGRETSETWYAADGVTVTDTLTFTYTASGQLATASNNEGTYTFTYDDQGRVIGVSEPFGVSLTFAYDANGNRTLVEDSFGGTTQSTYDAANQLVSELFTADGQPTLRIDLGYDANGQMTQETRYSDAAGTDEVGASAYTYGPEGNVTSIEHTDGSGNDIGDYTYSYDAAGDLVSEVDDGSATVYQYDATGQLIAAGPTGYAYDPNGNRTMPGYVTGPDNELLSDGTYNYTYDAEGNELTKTAIATGDKWTYGYDNLNQLVSAVETSAQGAVEVQAEYKYDVFGNRVEKDVSVVGPDATAVTRYAYDGWNPAKGTGLGTENFQVWATLDASGSLTTRYMYGDVVDQVFARVDQNGAAWLYTDHLGSVRVVTDGDGNVIDQISYDAYGNITSETNPAAGGVYKWTGQEFDAETGLQYSRARYYDATTGRWISQDPLGFNAGDSNLYRYVNNQPTNKTDPSGLDSIWVNDLGEVYWMSNERPVAKLGTLNGEMVNTEGYFRAPGVPPVSQVSLGSLQARVSKLNTTIPGTAMRNAIIAGARELDIAQNRAGEAKSMKGWPTAADPNVSREQAGRMAIDAGKTMVTQAAASAAMVFAPRLLLPAERALFNTARAGGRHSGLLRNAIAQRMTRNQVRSAISSLEGRVRQHLDKVANPANYVSNWAQLGPMRQSQIIRGWMEEAVTYAEQAGIFRGLLETLP